LAESDHLGRARGYPQAASVAVAIVGAAAAEGARSKRCPWSAQRRAVKRSSEAYSLWPVQKSGSCANPIKACIRNVSSLGYASAGNTETQPSRKVQRTLMLVLVGATAVSGVGREPEAVIAPVARQVLCAESYVAPSGQITICEGRNGWPFCEGGAGCCGSGASTVPPPQAATVQAKAAVKAADRMAVIAPKVR